MSAAQALMEGVENYRSVAEEPELATAEVDRLLSLSFGRAMSKQEAAEAHGSGTMSRLALMIKEKEGVRKCRLVVDLRRSGANSRASCPERIVLPRPQDLITDCLDLESTQGSLRRHAASHG